MKRTHRILSLVMILTLLLSNGSALTAANTLALPKSLKVIEEEAFYGDKSIGKVVLPDDVKEIHAKAFANSSLSEINLPDSLTYIDNSAFDGPDKVSITASEGTYAYQWAETNGYTLNGDDVIKVEEIEFNYDDYIFQQISVTMEKGEVANVYDWVEITVKPNNATNKQLYWTSSNPSVATINRTTGQIVAKELGETVFTASAADGSGVQSDPIELTVEIAAPKNFNVKINGQTAELSWTTDPDVTQYEVEWSRVNYLEDYHHEYSDGITMTISGLYPNCVYSFTLFANVKTLDGETVSRNSVSLEATTGEDPDPIPDPDLLEYSSLDNFVIEDGRITKYVGNGGDVAVPRRDRSGKRIAYIGRRAFEKCNTLTSVTIPNGIIDIEYRAFADCSNLQNVTISDGLINIDNDAFRGCSNLKSITIPSSVTLIASGAFKSCNDSILIYGVLGSYAENWANENGFAFTDLKECSRFDDFVIEDGRIKNYVGNGGDVVVPSKDRQGNEIISIGNSAFRDCVSLTSITIPDSVTEIGYWAFEGCTSLRSITIPNSVNDIGYSAFAQCNSLTNITIPASVTNIDGWTFQGCSSLTSLTIPNGVTNIGEHAFRGCDNLVSIRIPNSVTSIGEWAFAGCKSLTNITNPVNVTSIGDYAFSECISLKDLTIPNGVTSLGHGVFNRCSSLTDVTIPNSVTSIGSLDSDATNGDGTFARCTGLTSITIPNSVTNIGNGAFFQCTNLRSVTLPSSVTRIGRSAFDGCALTNITIPSSVTIIAGDAFSSCDFTSVTIPSGITSIEDWTFSHCSKLINITIPSGVTGIGECAFFNCGRLSSVTIPNSVIRIEERAFDNCDSLSSITIPASVTSIGSQSFSDCNSLKSITILGTSTSIEDNAFDGCSNSLIIYGIAGSNVESWAKRNGYIFRTGTEPDPSITAKSNVTSATEGQTVSITATTSNTTGTISYRWQQSNDGTSWSFTTLNGNTNKTLSFVANSTRLSYYYRVAVTDSIGTWYSNVVKVNYSDDIVAPVLDDSFMTSSDGCATMTWSKVTNAVGYYIWRSESKSSGYNKVKTITSGTTCTWKDSSLEQGIKYYYKIQAYSSSGTASNYSNIEHVIIAVDTDIHTVHTDYYGPTIIVVEDEPLLYNFDVSPKTGGKHGDEFTLKFKTSPNVAEVGVWYYVDADHLATKEKAKRIKPTDSGVQIEKTSKEWTWTVKYPLEHTGNGNTRTLLLNAYNAGGTASNIVTSNEFECAPIVPSPKIYSANVSSSAGGTEGDMFTMKVVTTTYTSGIIICYYTKDSTGKVVLIEKETITKDDSRLINLDEGSSAWTWTMQYPFQHTGNSDSRTVFLKCKDWNGRKSNVFESSSFTCKARSSQLNVGFSLSQSKLSKYGGGIVNLNLTSIGASAIDVQILKNDSPVYIEDQWKGKVKTRRYDWTDFDIGDASTMETKGIDVRPVSFQISQSNFTVGTYSVRVKGYNTDGHSVTAPLQYITVTEDSFSTISIMDPIVAKSKFVYGNNFGRYNGPGYTVTGHTGAVASHNGNDIMSDYGGYCVVSATDGYVKTTGSIAGYGNCVVVVSSGVYYYYGHLDKIFVQSKTNVEKGELLGFEGTTGNSGGNHLHFEARWQDGMTRFNVNNPYISGEYSADPFFLKTSGYGMPFEMPKQRDNYSNNAHLASKIKNMADSVPYKLEYEQTNRPEYPLRIQCMVPSKVIKGKGWYVRGLVASKNKLTSVKIEVVAKGSNEVVASTNTVNPDAYMYDLKVIDSQLKMGSISNTGWYTYRVTATDSSGKTVVLTSDFEVTVGTSGDDKPADSSIQ